MNSLESIDPRMLERIENDFGYHPATPMTAGKHNLARKKFYDLAVWVLTDIPAGRDQSLCLTALEDSLMRANKAIAMTAPLAPTP